MTTFDKREEGFGLRFAHDQQLKFKAGRALQQAAWPLGCGKARADRRPRRQLCALVCHVGIRRHRRARCHGKIRKDFEAKSVIVSARQISRTMKKLLAKAIADIKAGRQRPW